MTKIFILGALEAEKLQKNKVSKVLVDTLYESSLPVEDFVKAMEKQFKTQIDNSFITSSVILRE